jgi:hypothetical protein
VQLKEAQSLETWENEGGQSALSTAPVRILIVDDGIKSSDSLELMLNASGYSQTRVAYSGHAALAIAAEFQPAVVLLELTLVYRRDRPDTYLDCRLMGGRFNSTAPFSAGLSDIRP